MASPPLLACLNWVLSEASERGVFGVSWTLHLVVQLRIACLASVTHAHADTDGWTTTWL